jgi:hypothetical protein
MMGWDGGDVVRVSILTWVHSTLLGWGGGGGWGSGCGSGGCMHIYMNQGHRDEDERMGGCLGGGVKELTFCLVMPCMFV